MAEYTIERLGQRGDGIAQGPIYAPMTLPGEVVSGELNDDTLFDIKIIAPSEHRIAPPCPHFKACGGCTLQHASDELVGDWKLEMVRISLQSHGIETVLRPIITSPAQARRRASFAARRTKKSAMAGFHGRASGTIIEIPQCKLVDPALLPGLEIAKALARIGSSRKGALSVQVTICEAGLDVVASGGKPLDGPLRQHLAQFCEAEGLERLAWDGEVIAMRSPPIHRFGKAAVSPPPGAFLQATPHGEAHLLKAVREVTQGASRVVDLFAGCGTFTLPLAETAEVHAVEGDSEMLAAMDRGWRGALGLKTVTHEARDLFRRPLLPDELQKYDTAVLDPPRAGAQAQVAELAASSIARLAYVSCNPVTFARDVAQLHGAGYHLDWVQTVDQFRWSPHIELVGSLSRSR